VTCSVTFLSFFCFAFFADHVVALSRWWEVTSIGICRIASNHPLLLLSHLQHLSISLSLFSFFLSFSLSFFLSFFLYPSHLVVRLDQSSATLSILNQWNLLRRTINDVTLLSSSSSSFSSQKAKHFNQKDLKLNFLLSQ